MDDFGKDVGKSWRLSRLIPAYRATLLYFYYLLSTSHFLRSCSGNFSIEYLNIVRGI